MSFLTEDEEEEIAPSKSTKMIKSVSEIFTIMFSGMKGTSKSTTAYSVNKSNGRFVVLDFDGNSQRVIDLVVPKKKRKNFKVYNFKKEIDYVNLKSPIDVPVKAMAVYELVEDIIYNKLPASKNTPNFIIFDGFQRWVWICEMAMRKVHMPDKNPFTDGSNWNMWKERNFYVDRSYQGAQQIASDAILFTVHEVEKERSVKNEETNKFEKKPYQEPSWLSTVKEETDIVVNCTNSAIFGGENSFIHNVASNKVTGIEGITDVTGNPYALWEKILGSKIEPLIPND